MQVKNECRLLDNVIPGIFCLAHFDMLTFVVILYLSVFFVKSFFLAKITPKSGAILAHCLLVFFPLRKPF
jgi:hypothetical protein